MMAVHVDDTPDKHLLRPPVEHLIDIREADEGRTPPEEIAASARKLANEPFLTEMLDAANVYVAILDRHRQIVAANSNLLHSLGASMDHARGKRWGEVAHCVNVRDGFDGCGTAPRCAACGAFMAIVDAQKSGEVAEHECLMTVSRDGGVEAREFEVRAAPLSVGGTPYIVASFRDISAEKRREALEQVFFHDILNTISGIHGWSDLLKDSVEGDGRRMAERIAFLGERLKREVLEQRTLVAAEDGTLELKREPVRVGDVLASVERVFSQHEAARGQTLELAPDGSDEPVVTDAALLGRVLINMTKNAFEAGASGDTVRLWAETTPETLRFRVWNKAVMSREAQLRVFQRSFSTKARRGRGLGTFSMKLFGERYLGGVVSFESSEEAGTTFTIALPR